MRYGWLKDQGLIDCPQHDREDTVGSPSSLVAVTRLLVPWALEMVVRSEWRGAAGCAASSW